MIEDLLPYAPPAASWVAAGNCIAVLSGKEGAIRVRVFRMLVEGAVSYRNYLLAWLSFHFRVDDEGVIADDY